MGPHLLRTTQRGNKDRKGSYNSDELWGGILVLEEVAYYFLDLTFFFL